MATPPPPPADTHTHSSTFVSATRSRSVPQPRSALALDVGRKRIGLAGCDPLGLTVTPLRALARGSFEADIEYLNSLAQQRRVLALVVGLPLDVTGQPTAQSLHCQRYGERLARRLQLPLAWVNEHASTWAAGERHGLHGDRSGVLDSAAAALLLEQWLQDGPDPVLPATIEQSKTADAAAF